MYRTPQPLVTLSPVTALFLLGQLLHIVNTSELVNCIVTLLFHPDPGHFQQIIEAKNKYVCPSPLFLPPSIIQLIPTGMRLHHHQSICGGAAIPKGAERSQPPNLGRSHSRIVGYSSQQLGDHPACSSRYCGVERSDTCIDSTVACREPKHGQSGAAGIVATLGLSGLVCHHLEQHCEHRRIARLDLLECSSRTSQACQQWIGRINDLDLNHGLGRAILERGRLLRALEHLGQH